MSYDNPAATPGSDAPTGEFGGRHISEPLLEPLEELATAFEEIVATDKFREVGRCEYRGVTDDEALRAFRTLAETEGIIPALETSHALAMAEQVADEHDTIVVNLSGRGNKDMEQAAELFDLE